MSGSGSALSPCLRAFWDDTALPWGVLGPCSCAPRTHSAAAGTTSIGRALCSSRYSADISRTRFSKSGRAPSWCWYRPLLSICPLSTSRGSTPSEMARAVAVSRFAGSCDLSPSTMAEASRSIFWRSIEPSKSSSSPPASMNA